MMRIRWLLVFTLFSCAALANPDIKTWDTDKGAKVMFVAAPELPMVDVRVAFDAGSARDGAKWGLALLTNGLMPEGAGGLTEDEVRERFDDVGAQFGGDVQRDMAWFGLRSLVDSESLDPALDIFAKILTQPDVPAPAFERERKRLLVGLKQRQQDPSALAEDAFYANVFKGHPYASPKEGEEKTLAALKRDDLTAFYYQHYTARNAVIAIVGDLDEKQAKSLAEKLVERLPAGSKVAPLPAVEPIAAPIEVKIDHPSSQTHIRLGLVGVARPDPDFFPLYVGNHSLGGSGLVSRLFEEIREKRGLSYSVYSYLMPMRAKGPFLAGLETRNEQAQEALTLLRDSLKKYAEEGPTSEEHSASVKNITGGFPLRVDSNSEILEYLTVIGFYGLPLDYLDTFISKVEAVTLEQIKAAFKRRLPMDNLVTIIVGGKPASGKGPLPPIPASSGAARRH
jgi:zinc protease